MSWVLQSINYQDNIHLGEDVLRASGNRHLNSAAGLYFPVLLYVLGWNCVPPYQKTQGGRLQPYHMPMCSLRDLVKVSQVNVSKREEQNLDLLGSNFSWDHHHASVTGS